MAGRAVDRMKTNESYLRRQYDFMEFLIARPDLQSSFEDVARLMGKSIDDAAQYTWRSTAPHLLATEQAVIAYLEAKDEQKRAKVDNARDSSEAPQSLGRSFNVSELMRPLEAPSTQGRSKAKPKKRPRHQRPFVRGADRESYYNALASLQSAQFKLLGIHDLCQPLREGKDFRLTREAAHQRNKASDVVDATDKASGSLRSNPSIEQIQSLVDGWVGAGVEGDRQETHLGLTNAAIFLSSFLGGMSRNDSSLRCMYSDLEHVRGSHFARPRSFVDKQIFCIRSKESKTNRNGCVEYDSRLPAMRIEWCPILHEAFLVVFRHDCLEVPPNDFESVVRLQNGSLHRVWYSDHWYCSVASRPANTSFTLKGEVFQGKDTSKTFPYSSDSIAESWRESLAQHAIDTYHTLHLGRCYAALSHTLNGVPSAELSRVGRWCMSRDDFSLSYCLLPSTTTLSMIAGADDDDSYLPFWTLLEPPSSLTSLVLTSYDGAIDSARQRVDYARRTSDRAVSEALWDTQAVLTLEYLDRLRVIFVQGAMSLHARFPNHRIVRTHRLFKEAEFWRWSSTQQVFLKAMEELQHKFVAVFSSARGVSFGSHIADDGKIVLTPSSVAFATDWKVKNLFSSFCERVGAVGSSGDSIFADPPRQVSPPQTDQSEGLHSVSEPTSQGSTATRMQNDASDAIQEIASITSYADIKQDIVGLKRAVQHVLSFRGCEIIENGAKKIRADEEHNEDRPDQSDVSTLPLLSTLDKDPHPISSLYKRWTCGDDKGGRPLRDVSDAAKSKKRYIDRATVEECKKIRYIAVALELMMLDGNSESEAIQKLEHVRDGSSLDKLAKRIAADLKDKGLTQARKKITTQDVYNNKNYKDSGVFWKNL